MLALFGGVHIHGVLSQDARAAVYHEEVIAVFDTELLRFRLVFDARHFHEIEEVIAGGAQDAGSKLREEQKELWNDIVDVLPRRNSSLSSLRGAPRVSRVRGGREEITSIERVLSFVFGFDAEIFDKRRDTSSANIRDDREWEKCAEVRLGGHLGHKRREERVNVFEREIGFIEVGSHEAHAAGGVGVVYLRQDVLLRGDGGAGCVLPARLRVHIRHGGDVVEAGVIRRDTFELFQCRFVRHERLLHMKHNRHFHLVRFHFAAKGGGFGEGEMS